MGISFSSEFGDCFLAHKQSRKEFASLSNLVITFYLLPSNSRDQKRFSHLLLEECYSLVHLFETILFSIEKRLKFDIESNFLYWNSSLTIDNRKVYIYLLCTRQLTCLSLLNGFIFHLNEALIRYRMIHLLKFPSLSNLVNIWWIFSFLCKKSSSISWLVTCFYYKQLNFQEKNSATRSFLRD